MIISIIRKFLRPKHAFRFDEDDMNDMTEDDNDGIFDEQAAHGFHVAGLVYGRGILESDGVIESKRQQFRAVSVAWHEFLELTNLVTAGLKRKHIDTFDLFSASIARGKRLRRMNIDGQLQKMFGVGAEFRGCQREIIQAIMRGENFVMMVMRT